MIFNVSHNFISLILVRHKNKNTEYNADFSVSLADGFYTVGYQIAKQINKDNSYFGFIGLAPGVVNFNLSAELFIKAIHLIILHQPANGHHLWNLFKKLPLDIKNEIENRYIENKKDINKELSSYRIKITKVETDEKEGTKSDPTPYSSVKELLLVHNDAFEKFRYLHEFPSEVGYDYEYNFDEMNAFVKALKSYSYELINKRGKRFGIKKV